MKDPKHDKITDFGEAYGILEKSSDSFLTAKNMPAEVKDLNSLYNTLVNEVCSYKFESIDDKNSINL